jgi:hypothetical protein
MDRAFEADGRPLPRQLLGGRTRPAIPGSTLSGLPASEIGLDEVAWHALDAMAEVMTRKGQNISTLAGAEDPSAQLAGEFAS